MVDCCDDLMQVPGGVVGERFSGSAHRSVWNVVVSEWHCGGLGGRQRLLDGWTVPVDRGDEGQTCRRRSQDCRVAER